MERITLERQQVWVYLLAISIGLILGTSLANPAALEWLLWPLLMLLLYVTFVQVPLLHIRRAFADRRFVSVLLLGNFVLVPLLVWGLMQFLPDQPALRLGVLLVLLVPCTDWFITFTQLGGGDTPRAIAVTPLNLMLQLLLLPLYLLMAPGLDMAIVLSWRDVMPALVVVTVPLLAAALTERWMEAVPARLPIRDTLGWWPVPLLALVVCLIATTQISAVRGAMNLLPLLVPLFTAFLIFAALIAWGLSRWMKLPAIQGRTLAFSLGTRNSFVVLPFALSLPQGWEVVAVVIVVQSLVELLGMVLYLWWLPRYLFPTS
ncbi:MAG: arsenic resistance protein [Alcanivoracaceae bacterium]